MEKRRRENEVGDKTESEEAPLVVGSCESAGEPGGNPDPDENDVEDDGSPANTGSEAEGDDKRRPADKPIDILREEDLPSARGAEIINDNDGSRAQVGSHCVVGDGAGEERDGEEIMEDFLSIVCKVRETDEDQEGEEVNGGDGP